MTKRDRYFHLDVLLAIVFLFWYIFTGRKLVLVPAIIFSWMDITCFYANKKNPLKIKIEGKSDGASDISDREEEINDDRQDS